MSQQTFFGARAIADEYSIMEQSQAGTFAA
jgi:hypothetical protein